jgi:hypothetical protein
MATPSPISAFESCSRDRKQALAEAFFAAYNAQDLDAVLALWDVSLVVGYHDNIHHEEHDIRGADALREYLMARFALDDRFEITDFEFGTNPYTAAFYVAFTRSSDDGRYAGNAKLVCSFSEGKLVGVVMSSRLIEAAHWTPAAAHDARGDRSVVAHDLRQGRDDV